MPKTNLMEAIKVATSDDPQAKPRKKPGPAKLKDQDGKPVLKSRKTRSTDLRTDDVRKAAAEELNAAIEEWYRQDEEIKAAVLVKKPGLEGEELQQAMFAEMVARHSAEYANKPAPSQEQAVPPQDQQDQQEVPAQVLPETLEETVGSYTREGFEVLSENFIGRSVTDVPEGSPFGTLPEIREHHYRLLGTAREFILQQLVNGRWQEESRGTELGSIAFGFAYRRIDCPRFHELASVLPRYRPARQARLDAEIAAKSANVKPLSREDREKLNEQIRNSMGNIGSAPTDGVFGPVQAAARVFIFQALSPALAAGAEHAVLVEPDDRAERRALGAFEAGSTSATLLSP